MKKTIPPYRVVNWDFNRDEIEFYDIMPYLVSIWKEEKKRKHKVFCDFDKDRLRMPETFEEFKRFILDVSLYNFWARCEYEVIVTGWPVQKREHKLDVYEQIKNNIDVVTKHFMDYVHGRS